MVAIRRLVVRNWPFVRGYGAKVVVRRLKAIKPTRLVDPAARSVLAPLVGYGIRTSRNHEIFRRPEHRSACSPFSLGEEVAGDSPPDEGLRRRRIVWRPPFRDASIGRSAYDLHDLGCAPCGATPHPAALTPGHLLPEGEGRSVPSKMCERLSLLGAGQGGGRALPKLFAPSRGPAPRRNAISARRSMFDFRSARPPTPDRPRHRASGRTPVSRRAFGGRGCARPKAGAELAMTARRNGRYKSPC
jgi:hypothetical protein